MNTWQVEQQIKFLLDSQKWPDTPEGVGLPVWGAVEATGSGAEAEALGRAITPVALIHTGSSTADDEHPQLEKQQLGISIMTLNAGDRGFGSAAVLGANRIDGMRGSNGRGLLEVQERIKALLGLLTDELGVRVINVQSSNGATLPVQSTSYTVARQFVFEALVEDQRYYHEVTRLRESGGTVTWVDAPDRFDSYKILIRSDPSSPPLTPTSGVDRGEVDFGVESYVAPASGFYSFFVEYADSLRVPASADSFSDPVSVEVP